MILCEISLIKIMSFSRVFSRLNRSFGGFSPKNLKNFYSTLDLMSNENNYDKQYYGLDQNHREIIENIRLRQMEDHFKDIFDEKTLRDRQLLSDAIIRNVELMPNRLDPIWY